MDAEIRENDTWELKNLPSGARKVGLKWVQKTKFNENGGVESTKSEWS